MGKAVLVTTQHRGVFFGRLENGQDENARSLVLIGCRNAIYWSKQTGNLGFLGLAAEGPGEGSTVGATAPRVLLHDVTSVTDCTEAATKKWESWQ